MKGLSAISCISLISLLRFGVPDLDGLDLVLCLDIIKYTTRGHTIPDINRPKISIKVLYQHSYPQVYPQINLTVKNTICPGVEESGVKWVIEHLDRWGRNVQTIKPPTTKPPYCQIPKPR